MGDRQAETPNPLVEQSATVREGSFADEPAAEVEIVDQLFSNAELDLSELLAGGDR
jgi:hypothetical protein